MLNAVADKETLSEVLSRANKLVSRIGKGTFLNPGVLLKVEKESVSVYATDMDNWLVQSFPIYEGEEGQAYVPVKEFLTVLKGADGGSVSLRREGAALVVEIGEEATYKINLYDDEEFPAIPQMSVSDGLMISLEEFFEGVEKVGWCASKDDPRPFLTGIYVHTGNGEIRFVASDGSVLGFYAKNGFSGNLEIILPAYISSIFKTLPKDKGIASVKDGIFYLSTEDKNVNVLLAIRGIEDKYVDYESILPTEFVAEAVVDTKILLHKLNRMMSMAPDTYEVDFELDEGHILLHTISPKGEGYEKVAAETSGSIKVRLIGSHLSGILKSISEDSTRISFSGESTPVKIGPEGNERHFYLTLPIA